MKDPAWTNSIRNLVAEAQGEPEMSELVRRKIIEPRRQDGRALLLEGIRRGEVKSNIRIETVLDFVFDAVSYRLLLHHGPVDGEFAHDVVEELFTAIRND